MGESGAVGGDDGGGDGYYDVGQQYGMEDVQGVVEDVGVDNEGSVQREQQE